MKEKKRKNVHEELSSQPTKKVMSNGIKIRKKYKKVFETLAEY